MCERLREGGRVCVKGVGGGWMMGLVEARGMFNVYLMLTLQGLCVMLYSLPTVKQRLLFLLLLSPGAPYPS